MNARHHRSRTALALVAWTGLLGACGGDDPSNAPGEGGSGHTSGTGGAASVSSGAAVSGSASVVGPTASASSVSSASGEGAGGGGAGGGGAGGETSANGGGDTGGGEPFLPESCWLLDGPVECNPLTNAGCDEGDACYTGTSDDEEGVFCFPPPNTQQRGDPCTDEGPFCEGGLACDGDTCEPFCCDDSDCDDVDCITFDDDWGSLGVCYTEPVTTTTASSSASSGGGGVTPLPASCWTQDEPFECNPLTNEGCDGGEACDIAGGGVMNCFAPPNTQDDGEPCDAGDGPFCMGTFACDGDTCARFCCEDSDCASGVCSPFDPETGTLGACFVPPGSTSSTSSSSSGGGPALPPGCWLPNDSVECDPRTNQGCTSSETCDSGTDQFGDPGVFCFPPPNTQGEGESCDPVNGPFCEATLGCTGESCAPLCCDDGDCATGSCVPYDPANGTLGLCIDDALAGVGDTVAECQGEGELFGDLEAYMPSGFAIYTGDGVEIYLYSRTIVDDLAYGGTDGENKIRIIIGPPTGDPNTYQGLIVIAEWSDAQGRWVDLVDPSDLAYVYIDDFYTVDPEGLMCNGRVLGSADAGFDGGAFVQFVFDVPLLTPDFPSSQPGPP